MGVCPLEHMVLRTGKIIPSLLCLHVNLTQLPLPQWIGLASLKAMCLLILGHAEVEFDEDVILAEGRVIKKGEYAVGGMSGTALYGPYKMRISTKGRLLSTSSIVIMTTKYTTP